jgi:hypothetical protein
MSQRKCPRTSLAAAASLVVCVAAFGQPAKPDAPFDTARLEQTTGMKGKLDAEEGVLRLSKPRKDVPVHVGQWQVPPFMGVGSWAAFTKAADGQTMLMGDNALFEDEVNAAMSAALDNGLQVTALHNHFFFDQPKVYFMHISGMGDASQLAQGVRKLEDAVEGVRSKHHLPSVTFGPAVPMPSHISGEPLERILAHKGEASDGMFKVTIGRKTSVHGDTMRNQMGVNTWAGFAGTDDNAVVDGDFAILESELQPVLKSLRGAGINIVAIHQHMTDEQPRMMFLHYWGQGKAQQLAQAVKSALDLTHTAQEQS